MTRGSLTFSDGRSFVYQGMALMRETEPIISARWLCGKARPRPPRVS